MQKEESIVNLAAAKKILDGLGIPFHLFLGTALGAFRDGDFCPGDEDDIDIAVHCDHYEQKDSIIEAFKRAGFEWHEYNAPNSISPEICFQKKHEGWHTKVDIFFIVPRGKNVIFTFYTPEAQNRQVPLEHFLSAHRVVFHGVACNVPFRPSLYMERNYGPGWKTPIHRKNWQYDKDNQTKVI